jgi:hypothetical protein
MITFTVVRERYGWAIRMGERMTTLFRSRDMAVHEANCLADSIRRHGERTEVIVEDANPTQPCNETRRAHSSRIDVSSQVQRLGLE